MKLKTLKIRSERLELPLVPLRELVVFPAMVIPFFVGRGFSIRSIEEAMNGNREIFLACQKNNNEKPDENDIFPAGTLAKVLQLLKLPDGTIRVLAEGIDRGIIQRYNQKKDFLSVSVRIIADDLAVNPTRAALMATILESFKRYTSLKKKIPADIVNSIDKIEFPNKLIDMICSHLQIKVDRKIELLQIENVEKRLESLAVTLESENEVLSIQNRITSTVKKKMERTQKEYFLNEQIKQINKELGYTDDDPTGAREIEKNLKSKDLPEDIFTKSERELKRLAKLQPMSPESGIIRTYLEWIADLPWRESTEDIRDIQHAAKILDEDHYNMEKPKDRILDFIAVHQLQETMKGPILCFVGPPGTGKTSLGKSVARALGREFVRISLGGVRDEAEIRGHRKTYVGALPGKIIQGIKKAGVINPVFLLDEIDKLSSDFRGDPAAALLEVLDPEQNNTFTDHYLEVPYDLSKVLFITTANSIHNIPYPLRDRMEIIEIPGYTDYEKIKIAQNFLIPKQLNENGLSWAGIVFHENALRRIIRLYTMESGVRNLERKIAAIIRKIARRAVKRGYAVDPEKREKSSFKVTVTEKGIRRYLGKEIFSDDLLYTEQRPGLAYGLAWTEMGGTLLPVEVAVINGNGDLILTGNLGDVMKESAKIALSFIRAHSKRFKLPDNFNENRDVHVHVPEGAIPKDGPSAGITLTAAILSAFSGKCITNRLAMTGEITLTGRLLPIGGVKEKVLAAYRNKMAGVLMPDGNKKDVADIPRDVQNALEIYFVSSVDEALQILLKSNKPDKERAK